MSVVWTMQRTWQTLRKASPRNIIEIFQNPSILGLQYRRIRASVIKDLRNEDEIRNRRPHILANCIDIDPQEIRRYQAELDGDPDFLTTFEERVDDLRSEGVYSGTTPKIDCETIYLVCRAIRPKAVIVTGARYGAFDAFIAAALGRNDQGKMFSIDLPGVLSAFDYGYLVDDRHRDRWELRLGDARDILSDLIEDIGPVDLFLHDSLHTPEHMKWEYEIASTGMAEGGILASHDILVNNAFQDFVSTRFTNWDTIGNLGIARIS